MATELLTGMEEEFAQTYGVSPLAGDAAAGAGQASQPDMSQLPPGAKQLPDGGVQLPDGRIVDWVP